MKAPLVALFVIALLAGIASCERWKYRECRKVGHSQAYCVLQVGAK